MDNINLSTTLWATVGLLSLVHFAGTAFSPRLHPPELTIKEGETVIFACIPLLTVALPLLEMNDILVPYVSPDPRLHYENFGMGWSGNQTYYLEDVRLEEDGTTFQCFVGGYGSNILTINVVVPPTVTVLSEHVTILEGETTELAFEVFGHPFPDSYTWFYDGELFTGSERVAIVNTSLVIRDASRQDSGNYTLVARSNIGEDSASIQLEVAYNEFLTIPRSVSAFNGETVTMSCVHRFGWSYAWRANSVILSNQTAKANITHFGTRLEYGPVDYSDHALQIECVAQLRNGHVFVSAPAEVTVYAPPFVQAYATSIAIEGRRGAVEFLVHSHPSPTSFTYYYNSEELDLSSDGKITVSEDTPSSLIIANVSRELAGNYTLVVTNSLGEGEGAIDLTVYYKPEILPLLRPAVAQVNRSVSIPCGDHIIANPLPQITWGHDESPSLLNHSKFTVLPSGELFLRDASYSDAGPYECTATNVAGESSLTVRLLVLDPPSEPQDLVLLDVGPTWAHVRWAPPLHNGSLPVSTYRVVAVPQLSSGNILPNNTSRGSNDISSWTNTADGVSSLVDPPQTTSGPCNSSFNENTTWPDNSACSEVVCESVERSGLSPEETFANITGLVPDLDYIVQITALSNGTNLQSAPSDPVNFTTQLYVPGLGSVCASVHGPAAMAVGWTLAYSGGLPVLFFEIGYRKIGTTHWRAATTGYTTDMGERARTSLATNGRYVREDDTDDVMVESSGDEQLSFVPGDQRGFVVRGLEGEEVYVFRVRGWNELGYGEYVESEEVLSHTLGVPSQPSRPQVMGWSHDHAIIATTVPKMGSALNFSITLILQFNVTSEVLRHTVAVEGYEEGSEIVLVFPNVSYDHHWRFQAFASNHLGDSEHSAMSAAAHEDLMDSSHPYDLTALVLMPLFAVLNVLIVVSVSVFCVVMGRDTCRQRENMARRAEMAQAFADAPLSPRLFPSISNIDARSSPEGRSNTMHGPRRQGIATIV